MAKDLELGRISLKVANEIFGVAWDPERRRLDVAGTERLRADARAARLRRGKPYARFVEEFVTEEPPASLAYYGSWRGRHR